MSNSLAAFSSEPDIPRFTDIFYIKDSGLYWKETFGPRSKKDSRAGGINNKGYRRVLVGTKRWLEHRILFYMYHGYLPKIVDHADGDTLNNSIENLREATSGKNRANSKRNYSNRVGYKGVDFRENRGYRVRVKSKEYGYFETPELAARHYDKIAKEWFGEFAKLNFPQEN